MLILPDSTVFGRRIPKQKFYEKLSVNAALRRVFIEQIESILWRNKLSPDTINIPKGEKVSELEILQINLRQQDIDTAVLELIDREIPYHILFLLEYGGNFQARIGYKESSGTKAAFKVSAQYQTDWMSLEDLPLFVDGLTLDAVYENFVRQVAGELLSGGAESLADTVSRNREKQKLSRRIAVIEAKILKEKQFNRKVALNAELKELCKSYAALE